MTREPKVLISVVLLWFCLYAVTSEIVFLLLTNDQSLIWSAVPSTLLYLIPGYVLGRYVKSRWFYYALGLAILGRTFWFLHSQIIFLEKLPFGRFLLGYVNDIVFATIGAWVGFRFRKRKRTSSNNSFERDSVKRSPQ